MSNISHFRHCRFRNVYRRGHTTMHHFGRWSDNAISIRSSKTTKKKSSRAVTQSAALANQKQMCGNKRKKLYPVDTILQNGPNDNSLVSPLGGLFSIVNTSKFNVYLGLSGLRLQSVNSHLLKAQSLKSEPSTTILNHYILTALIE